MSVADILLYYVRLANTAALSTERTLQQYSAQHATAQHKAILPTPNPSTVQLAGGKRSHDTCQPATLCGHRELRSETRVARLSSLTCLYVLLQDYFAFLDNMYSNTVRTTMHHLRPPARKPTCVSSIEDESGSTASPAILPNFIFLRKETHTDVDEPPAREELAH